MKIVVLDSHATISDDMNLDNLMEFGEVIIYDRTPKELTVERIGDAQAILTNKTVITKEVINACPNLKYIGLFATGYNIIDVAHAKEKGIVVCNAPGYSTDGVAQLTIAFILHFYSMVASHNDQVKQGDWQNCADFCFYSKSLTELCHKTIGLIGFGNIAKKVAQIALAFNMNVLVYNRTIYSECENEHLKFVSLEQVYKNSDIVSLHCPLTADTEQMIDKKAIAMMKRHAVIINTARGGLVNEYDLAQALNSGRIYGVGVDVVSREPILAENPLLTAKNCIITPHIGWAGKETRLRLLDIVYDNIKHFVDGDVVNNVAQ